MNFEQTKDYLKISRYIKVISEKSQEALLSELIGCYIFKKESTLISLLLKDDFEGFQNLVQYMNEEGENLKNLMEYHVKNSTE